MNKHIQEVIDSQKEHKDWFYESIGNMQNFEEFAFHREGNKLVFEHPELINKYMPRKLSAHAIVDLMGYNEYSSPLDSVLTRLFTNVASQYEYDDNQINIGFRPENPYTSNPNFPGMKPDKFRTTSYTRYGDIQEKKLIQYVKENINPDIQTPSEYHGILIDTNHVDVYSTASEFSKEKSHPFISGIYDARTREGSLHPAIMEAKTGGYKSKWSKWVKQGHYNMDYRFQPALYAYASGVDNVIIASTYSTNYLLDHPDEVALNKDNVFTEQFSVKELFPDIEKTVNDLQERWRHFLDTGELDIADSGYFDEVEAINQAEYNYRINKVNKFKEYLYGIREGKKQNGVEHGYYYGTNKDGNLILDKDKNPYHLFTDEERNSGIYKVARDYANAATEEEKEKILAEASKTIGNGPKDIGEWFKRVTKEPTAFGDVMKKVSAPKEAVKDAISIKEANDIFRLNASEMKAMVDTVMGHISDVTKLSSKEIFESVEKASKEFKKGDSKYFSYAETPALKEFSRALGHRKAESKIRKQLYESDTKQAILDKLDEIIGGTLDKDGNVVRKPTQVSESLFEFLRGKASAIAKMPEFSDEEELADNLLSLYTTASSHLDEKDFADSVPILKELAQAGMDWRKKNAFNSGDWYEETQTLLEDLNITPHKRVNGKYVRVKNLLFDPVAAEIEQIQRNQSLTNQLAELAVKERKMTIQDVHNILTGTNEEQKEQLLNLFDKDRPIIKIKGLSNPHVAAADLHSSISSDPNTMDTYIARYRQDVDKEKLRRVNIAERLEEQYQTYQTSNDTRSLEAFSHLEISGLRMDEDGNIVVTSDMERAVRKFIGGLNKTFPFSMFKLKDWEYNRKFEGEAQFFAKGTDNPLVAEYLAKYAKVNGENVGFEIGRTLQVDVMISQGRVYWRNTGSYVKNTSEASIASGAKEELKRNQWVELTEARNQFTVMSKRVGMMRKFSEGALGNSPYRDLSKSTGTLFDLFQETTGIHFDKIVETKEKGNFTELMTSFSPMAAEQIRQDKAIMAKFINPKTASSFSREEVESVVHGALITMVGIEKYVEFLDKNTYEFSEDMTKKMIGVLQKQSSADPNIQLALRNLGYIQRIQQSDSNIQDVIFEMIGSENTVDKQFKNSRLGNLLSKYIQDPQAAITQRYVGADAEGLGKKGAYRIRTFGQELQKKLSEEVLINIQNSINPEDSGTKISGITSLFAFLNENLGKNGTSNDLDKVKDLAAALKMLGEVDYEDIDPRDLKNYAAKSEGILNTILSISDRIQGGSVDDTVLGLQLQNIAKANVTIEGDIGEDKRRFVNRIVDDERIVIKKSQALKINPRKVVKDINEGHINRAFNHVAKETISFARQFITGGLKDTEHFTTYSLYPYNLAYRLNEMLDDPLKVFEFTGFGTKSLGFKLNLGLDKKYLTSAGSIMFNLTARRFLPVWGALSAIDFIDDVSKKTTGTGIYEAGMSGLANNYLALKKFTGAIGLDDGLKGMTKDNAIVRYFSGFTGDENPEWKTYEEQKKYYEKGYSAIRKARFWTFGSANEFRGGGISYFEPNTLRILRGNPRDASLYNGSFWEKWSPANLLDPYHMEKLHAEDRPYPVSGPLFDAMTPWGITLNSTIGDIIKPRVQLHSDRLKDGVDVKALISQINTKIREKAQGNNNLFYVTNGKLRSMDFESFNHPDWDTNIFTIEDGQPINTGDYQHYIEPRQISETIDRHYIAPDATEYPGNGYGENRYPTLASVSQTSNVSLSSSEKVDIAAATGNPIAQGLSYVTSPGRRIIKANNDAIRKRAGYDKTQGFMLEEKLYNQETPLERMIENQDEIADIMNQTSKADYVHELAVSSRMLGGFYGYMAGLATGYGDNNNKRIATSQDITSTSRRFWDSGVGGFGGDLMEIYRRVIPEYRRFQTVNPLMNKMPEWMPERYRFGDPYTAVPQGEMRMPGKGYEAINELHPDIYGMYGAFDRFKILADVAPTSAEYKVWKKIAQKTVIDPEMKAEMEDIKDRVRRQTKQHDFAPYQYVGRDVNYRQAYVTELLSNGQFKVAGDDTTYKLAGTRVKANENESSQEVFQRYLAPGSKVRLAIDANINYARNKDKARSINAAIIVNGESLGEVMQKNGDAVVRKSDVSAASTYARHGTTMNMINWASEAFMHVDIPIIHSRWFRANDALEDYKDQYVYGTSFQSWDNITGTFIMPAIRKGSSSPFWVTAGIVSDILYNNVDSEQKGAKFLVDLYDTFNPNATFASTRFGAGTKKIFKRFHEFTNLHGLMGKIAGMMKFGAEGVDTFKNVYTRRAGIMAGLAYAAYNNTESLPISVLASARLGYMTADLFAGQSPARSFKWAKIGAAIGLARWAASKKLLAKDETANTFIPDETRKRWELEDYFDRLEYMKYNALFEEAASKASSKEGVDIKKILFTQHKEAVEMKDTKIKIKEALRNLSSIRTQDSVREQIRLHEKLENLHPSATPLTGGEYTKSAVMYYNAMQSTMYALDETSSMADIVRALPKTDREYFMEFVQEKDPDKRDEIMKVASPQIRKALNMLWYQKFDKPESNESYFSNHKLPAPTWSGWKPNVDLADVKARVLNEEIGAVTSDYGIYSSQYRDPDVMNAPLIGMSDGGDGWVLSALKMQAMLNGMGLIGTEVSVEPQEESVIKVAANLTKIIPYQIDEAIRGMVH